ncbi:MAG TPA: DUF6702 family protein [Gemmatimonadaceae bacterium]|nr:DUF6702 family protein [Gemmatimonadaceae bacterium]
MLSGAARHPIHVSNTDVDLSRDGRSLEVTVRIFSDDLEEAITPAGAATMRFGTSPAPVIDSLLLRYLVAHVRIGSTASNVLPMRLVGHEQRDGATQAYLEFALSSAPVRLHIEQSVLLDRYDDQTNLVHVTVGGVKRSALLRRGHEQADFTF